MFKNDGDSQVITTFSIIKENKSNIMYTRKIRQNTMVTHFIKTFHQVFETKT